MPPGSHLKAPFRILRAARPVISAAVKAERAAGEERITRKVVNISSVAGTSGNVGQSNYSAAKAGVIGLTRTLSKEWGRYDVTVNCVAFGLIRTRLTEAPAGGGSTISVAGRDIAVGVNPDLPARLEKGIPLGRAPRRRRRPGPSTCCARRSPTTSAARSSPAAADSTADRARGADPRRRHRRRPPARRIGYFVTTHRLATIAS